MFLEQISAPRIIKEPFSGYLKCMSLYDEYCDTSRFMPPDEVGVNITQEEFDAKYYSNPQYSSVLVYKEFQRPKPLSKIKSLFNKLRGKE